MKHIFITLVLSFMCVIANADNKLHITRTSDMCSDYYVLTVDKNTVYVSDYEYEQGIVNYYNDVIKFANSRLKPLAEKVARKNDKKSIYISNLCEKLFIDINVCNPTYHKVSNQFMAFYELGTLYDNVGKLIDMINNNK